MQDFKDLINIMKKIDISEMISKFFICMQIKKEYLIELLIL